MKNKYLALFGDFVDSTNVNFIARVVPCKMKRTKCGHLIPYGINLDGSGRRISTEYEVLIEGESRWRKVYYLDYHCYYVLPNIAIAKDADRIVARIGCSFDGIAE